jgi:hypothetical protein
MLVAAQLDDVAGRFSLSEVFLLGGDHVLDDLIKYAGRDGVAFREDDAPVFLTLKQVSIEKLRFAVPAVLRAFSQVLRQLLHLYASPCGSFPRGNTTSGTRDAQPQIVGNSTDSSAGGIA